MNGAFAVMWSDDALAEAELWTNPTDRADVTLAVGGVDEAVSRQPDQKGVEIAEGLRKIVVGPLCAYFSVDHAAHRVAIEAVASA